MLESALQPAGTGRSPIQVRLGVGSTTTVARTQTGRFWGQGPASRGSSSQL